MDKFLEDSRKNLDNIKTVVNAYESVICNYELLQNDPNIYISLFPKDICKLVLNKTEVDFTYRTHLFKYIAALRITDDDFSNLYKPTLIRDEIMTFAFVIEYHFETITDKYAFYRDSIRVAIFQPDKYKLFCDYIKTELEQLSNASKVYKLTTSGCLNYNT